MPNARLPQKPPPGISLWTAQLFAVVGPMLIAVAISLPWSPLPGLAWIGASLTMNALYFLLRKVERLEAQLAERTAAHLESEPVAS